MAVQKRELNWSTYQDKQLRVLENLEKSFSSSVKQSKIIEDNLGKLKSSIEDMTRANRTIAEAIDYINPKKRIKETTDQFSSSMSKASKSLVELATAASKTTNTIYLPGGETHRVKSTEEFMREAEDRRSKEDEEFNRRRDEMNASLSRMLERIDYEREKREERVNDSIEKIGRKIHHVVDKLADGANEFSDYSNTLLALSGSSGAEIRALRGDIVHDITTELNRDTGYFYDPKDVYATMVSVSNMAGIGNMDTLKELTRPILLAQESMDINISELSSLLGRWHTRYQFSSLNMENIVDNIRSNTAGNQATAEATMKNLLKLDNYIAIYANGDRDKMTSMSDSIARGGSWIESMGGDSGRYTDYIQKIASGDYLNDASLLNILQSAGVSVETANRLFSSGDIEGLYESLFRGEVGIAQRSGIGNLKKGITPYAQTLAAQGLDVEALTDAYAMSMNATDLATFIQNTSKETAAESVEDKYISRFDQINNWLSKIESVVSSLQEKVGIGLDDILKAVLAFASIKYLFQGTGGLGNVLKGAGSTGLGWLGSFTKGLKGVSTIASTAAPSLSKMATGLVGVGIAAEGISTYVDTKDAFKKGDKRQGWSEIGEGAGSIGGALAGMKVGALAGTAVGGPLGTLIGGAIGAIGGGLAGGALGRATGGSSYDATQSHTSMTSAQRATIKSFYDAVSKKHREYGNDVAQEYTLNEVVPYLASIGVSSSILDKYKHDIGTPDFLKDYDNGKFDSYAIGSNYISKDQIALLHEGEAVIPKKYNPMVNANMTIDALKEAYKRAEGTVGNDLSQEYLRESLETLSEIKEFLVAWKSDNIKQANIRETKNRFSNRSSFLSNYMVEQY